MKILKIAGLLSLITLFSFPVGSVAQDHSIPQIKRVESEPVLTADKITIKNELLAIDSLLLKKELAEENAMLPADALYDGQWNTQFVRAYSGVQIPDTFTIDVSSFVMPFEGKVTSKYGPRGRRFHYGYDIKVQTGDTIVAAFDGKVRVRAYERRGYGYYIVLRHPNGLETVYGHFSEFLVEQDEVVKAGQPIGLGGNTGRSTGSHLHLEFRFLGQPINPVEIVDFENFCTHDEKYVFNKKKVTQAEKKFASVKYHRVKKGDTLGAIARRYGISINQLCRLNGIKPTTTLKIGRSLRYT